MPVHDPIPAPYTRLSDDALLISYERAAMDPHGEEAVGMREEIVRRWLLLE